MEFDKELANGLAINRNPSVFTDSICSLPKADEKNNEHFLRMIFASFESSVYSQTNSEKGRMTIRKME